MNPTRPTLTKTLTALALAGTAACAEVPAELTAIDHGPNEAASAEAQVEDADLADALGGVDLGEILAEIMRSGGTGGPGPVSQYCTIGGGGPPPPPPPGAPEPPPDPPGVYNEAP